MTQSLDPRTSLPGRLRTAVRQGVPLAAGVVLLLGGRASAQALGPDEPREGPATFQSTEELYDDTKVRDISIDVQVAGDWIDRLGCQRGRGNAPPPSDEDFPATLVVDGERLEQVGVRCKGNSSVGIAGRKKPFNLTMDSFVPDQTLWGYDVVNLNNNWNDPSQLREALALRALGEFMPTPRFSFARVTVNGEYLGMYTMVEQVDRRFSRDMFPRNGGGLMVKGDSPVRIAFNSSALTWKGESLAVYKQDYEVKGSYAGSDEGYELLRETIRALDAPVAAGGLSAEAFPEGIRQFMDVDSALWYLVGNNVLANYDSYYVGKNFYFYRGSRDERFHVIPWDLGLSYGQFGLRGSTDVGGPGGGGNTAIVDPYAQADDVGRPLVRRLLAVPEFAADYNAHYRDFLATVFTPAGIDELGQAYQDLVRDAVREEVAAQGNVAGMFTFAHFEANLREPVTLGGGPGGPRGGAPGIRSLVQERSTFLSELPFLAPPDAYLAQLVWSPEAPSFDENVQVDGRIAGVDAADSVELRYRVNGGGEERVAMTSGSDGSWSATIPRQSAGARVTFALRAGFADGRAAFFPAANQTAPFTYEVAEITLPRVEGGDLVINEFMADNKTTLADSAGEFDDWVELYNRGTSPVGLGGTYLSDDPRDPWQFPLPDVELGPGEYFLVWCDGDVGQGPDHAPFGLDRSGEALALSTTTEIIGLVEFPEQTVDVSYARLGDGTEEWVQCTTPSPLAPNVCEETVGTGTLYLPLLSTR